MAEKKLWMVRAGRGAVYLDDFLEGGFVGIDPDIGPLELGTPKREIKNRLIAACPEESEGTLAVWATQILKLLSGFEVGDEVTTYDSGQRIYFLGTITGELRHRPDHEPHYQRPVEWRRKVPRDTLSVSTRNSLGSISSLFQVSPEAAEEIRKKSLLIEASVEEAPPAPAPAKRKAEETSEKEILDEVVAKAEDFIEDRIAQLNWQQMQELVAGILRAMEYKARVSAKGADRGVDIFASPDGLGLEQPRIFVEVKHRRGTPIGAQEVRAFVGGRQQGDRCLYVSTGGFTREARYEADRSTIPPSTPPRTMPLPVLWGWLLPGLSKARAKPT